MSVVLTAILRATGLGDSADETVDDDYEERDGTAGAHPLPATPEQQPVGGAAGT